MRQRFSTNIAQSILNSHYPTLLKNNTNKNIITGGQPVLNTYNNVDPNIAPEELKFYYPLSPDLGLLVIDNKSFIKNNYTYYLSESEVKHYNDLIIQASCSQIYAANHFDLKKYELPS